MQYLIMGIGIYCVTIAASFAETTPPKDKNVGDKITPIVFVRPLKVEEIAETYNYPARVVPKVNAAVLSEYEGVVTKILAPLGARVKAGERLLQIKHTDPIYQYAAAYVRASVTGIVSEINVREGTQVARNQDLLTITDPSKIRIQVEIAAIDLNSITAGIGGEFRLSGRDLVIPVKVAGVSPFVNPASGTATCELTLNDEKAIPLLNPGLVGQVSFKANVHKGILVPDHAVYYKEGNTYLRVVDGEQIAKRVEVVLGRKQKGYVEILKGVDDGQVIIERSSRFVGDGQKVEVQNDQKKTS